MRDMTEREFQAALKRNGLLDISPWVTRASEAGDKPWPWISMVYDGKGNVRKRATIRHVLKRFAEIDKVRGAKR